jgi:hypothetical protein
VGPGLSREAQSTSVEVPNAFAHALRSETERKAIPIRTELGPGAVPFSGELYEQVSSNGALTIPKGKTIVLCGLRRAWPLIGFAIDPGNGGSLTAALRVTVRGVQSAVVAGSALVIPAGTPTASPAVFVAARTELIITNASVVADALNVRGTIYGMTS